MSITGWDGPPLTAGNIKDTNPKDAIGIAKVPASTVPREVIAEVGLAMMEGALKYGRHNYRDAGVRYSVYYDAMTRHIDAFHEGQDIDPQSGLSHLVKAIACLVVLRDSQFLGNWVDDRPPKLPDNWQDDLNAKAKALLEKYPNPLPAHTESDQSVEYFLWAADTLREPRVVNVLRDEDRDSKFLDRRGRELSFDGDGWRDDLREWRGMSPMAYGPFTEVIE